jgi:hypothetical protein
MIGNQNSLAELLLIGAAGAYDEIIATSFSEPENGCAAIYRLLIWIANFTDPQNAAILDV